MQLKWCEVNTPFSEDQIASGILYWPCNLYAINNSSWAETRANRVRTNRNQLLLSDGSDAYSTVYAILQYGVRIRINECTASDAVRIGCVRIGINSAGGLWSALFAYELQGQ